VSSAVEVSEQRVLGEFLELVQIDSVTFEESQIAGVLEAKLREIGFSVVNDGTGPSTGNVIARLEGTAPTGTPIVLNAHMYTVEPGRGVKPVVRDGIVRSSGDTVLGGDCKAPIAAILEGMRAVLSAGLPRPDLEVVFTYAEERSHVGARSLDMAGLKGKLCFTLDASKPIGKLICCAPGYYSLRAAFRGQSAHAGVAPEKGIDALVAAARAIARMRLGRIDEETTANIGLIRGGTARNAVPGLVELEGEARSRDGAKLVAQVQAMTSAMEEEAAGVGATLDLRFKEEYGPYRHQPDAPVVVAASRALERLGLIPELIPTGGGSDANDFNAWGLPALVMGCGMVGTHTLEESFAVADLTLLSRVVVELVSVAAAADTGY
jgi:tripeptide aminopeptidase